MLSPPLNTVFFIFIFFSLIKIPKNVLPYFQGSLEGLIFPENFILFDHTLCSWLSSFVQWEE